MNDLNAMIKEIDSTGGLNQNQKSELKGLARSLASAKGDLGPGKKKQIRDRIAQMKTAPPRPTTPTTPTTPRTPGTPVTPPPPPAQGGDKWEDFIKSYDKLSASQDKEVLRNIFGGNPSNNFAFV